MSVDLSVPSRLHQLCSSAECPEQTGRSGQPEAAEHPHAAKEMLQPPLPGGVPPGPGHARVQGEPHSH